MKTHTWPQPTEAEKKRFYSRIKQSEGCCEWQAGKSGGYGMFSWRNRPWTAHRLYMVWAGNGVDRIDMCVRHSCHNRSCVAPWHLSWGTPADNKQDSVKDNRHVFGARHHLAKIGPLEAIKIYQSYADERRSLQSLAEQYDISATTVSGIINGKKWAEATRDLRKPNTSTVCPSVSRHSFLSKDDILNIWSGYYAEGKTQSFLAQEFEVSRSHIGSVVSRKCHFAITERLSSVRLKKPKYERANIPKKSKVENRRNRQKYTEKQAVLVWNEYHSTNITQRDLAKKHGIGSAAVSRILRRITFWEATQYLAEKRKHKSWSPWLNGVEPLS